MNTRDFRNVCNKLYFRSSTDTDTVHKGIHCKCFYQRLTAPMIANAEDAVSLFRRRAFLRHLLLSRFLVGAQCRWQSQSQAGFIGRGCVDIHRWCRDELFIVHCTLVKHTPKWIHRRVDSTVYQSCSEYGRTLDSVVTSLKAAVTAKCICKDC